MSGFIPIWLHYKLNTIANKVRTIRPTTSFKSWYISYYFNYHRILFGPLGWRENHITRAILKGPSIHILAFTKQILRYSPSHWSFRSQIILRQPQQNLYHWQEILWYMPDSYCKYNAHEFGNASFVYILAAIISSEILEALWQNVPSKLMLGKSLGYSCISRISFLFDRQIRYCWYCCWILWIWPQW